MDFFVFTAGAPVGVKAALCEWSGTAETLVALQATLCTQSYDSDQLFERLVLLSFHWSVSGAHKTNSDDNWF